MTETESHARGYGLATHPQGSILVYYNMLGNLGKDLLTADGKSTNIASPESQRVLQTFTRLHIQVPDFRARWTA